MNTSSAAARRAYSFVVVFTLAISFIPACRTSITMGEAGIADSEIDESAKIPAKSFFGDPLFSQVKLSPDGRRVAVLLSRDQTEAILSVDLQTGERVGLAMLERRDTSKARASVRLKRMGAGRATTRS